MTNPPCVLTVAGSDSGGGAGVQADLKTVTVLGGFGMSVVAALTAQNGLGVDGVFAPPPEFVALQLRSVLDAFPVAAAKTGMLFSADIIEVAEKALRNRTFPLVVDPVCVSQSGHRLLREDAVDALKTLMVPQADLLTPNKPEAELLTGMTIETEADVAAAADSLLRAGAKAVLIKGGHFGVRDGLRTDWLAVPGEPIAALRHPDVPTTNNHGTGCALSAAVATRLAQGLSLRGAVESAQRFLNHCLRRAYAPGLGAGPPDHASWIVRRVED